MPLLNKDFQKTELHTLNISSNNLSSLPAELLLNVVLQLDEADISFTCLTPAQVSMILQKRLGIKNRVNLRGIVNYL